MPVFQLVANHLESALLAITAAGLLARGRGRFCWSFLMYVLWVLVGHVLMAWWAARFWSLSFYMASETGVFVLKAAIAIEIWRRSFASLPRARIRVGVLLAAAVLGTWMLELAPTGFEEKPFVWFVAVVNPRRQAGVLAMLTILVTGVSWYRVPLHPLHRAILFGFSWYLVAYTVGSSIMAWESPHSRRTGMLLITPAYIAALGWWARAAWSRPRAPHPVVTKLQPWARSW